MRLCAPTENVDVLSDALPPLTGDVPSETSPSKNSTLPVAVAGVTVAVTATDWPTTDGFGDVATATLLVAALTVCVCAADVLALKSVLPA